MTLKKKLTIIITNIIILLAVGTVFFHEFEGWGWIDSFYFTSTTLMTIGYGDLHPTIAMTKLFTVFFAFAGIGLMLYSLTTLASEVLVKKPFLEPRKIVERTMKTIAKDIMKKEEEVFKYEMKKLFQRKKKQKYNYKPRKKNKKKKKK
jgi:voltage-gated potassium channel